MAILKMRFLHPGYGYGFGGGFPGYGHGGYGGFY